MKDSRAEKPLYIFTQARAFMKASVLKVLQPARHSNNQRGSTWHYGRVKGGIGKIERRERRMQDWNTFLKPPFFLQFQRKRRFGATNPQIFGDDGDSGVKAGVSTSSHVSYLMRCSCSPHLCSPTSWLHFLVDWPGLGANYLMVEFSQTCLFNLSGSRFCDACSP